MYRTLLLVVFGMNLCYFQKAHAKPVVKLTKKANLILKGDYLIGGRISLLHVAGDPRLSGGPNNIDPSAAFGIGPSVEYMLNNFLGFTGGLTFASNTLDEFGDVDSDIDLINEISYKHYMFTVGSNYHGWNYDKLKICLGTAVGFRRVSITEDWKIGGEKEISESGPVWHVETSGRYFLTKKLVGFASIGYGMGIFRIGLDYKL